MKVYEISAARESAPARSTRGPMIRNISRALNKVYLCLSLLAQARTGPFSQSLLFPERVADRDWFDGNPYRLCGGVPGIATMTDLSPQPGRKKIVLLRESFFLCPSPWPSPARS